MRIAARWIHGWVAPEQIAVPHIKDAFEEDGSIVDNQVMDRVKSLAASIVSNTIKLRG